MSRFACAVVVFTGQSLAGLVASSEAPVYAVWPRRMP